tara:strand:- start:495 stop:710 length:216 start_codon:yes stop_codon:yes gene_type:complete
MYLDIESLKYTLPEEIIINKVNAAAQNFSKTIVRDCFDLGQEKNFEFDSSINSLVGCCSLGTGHRESFIDY